MKGNIMTETNVPIVTNLPKEKTGLGVKFYAKATIAALAATAACFGLGYALGKGFTIPSVTIETTSTEE